MRIIKLALLLPTLSIISTIPVSAKLPQIPEKRDLVWSKQFEYDRVDFTVAGHRGFIICPPMVKAPGETPWVWYAPSYVGGLPGPSNAWICKKLLSAGFAVCGVDVGESYGSPEGRSIFTEFHKVVVNEFGFSSTPCLWAQSRGGLMLYNWAAEHPELVKCIGGTYPVCNLESYPGLDKACGAYGMTESELRKHLKEHNPIERLEPIAKQRVPILHLHGDKDSVVPIEANTSELARRYRALKGTITVIVVRGKGHEEVPEFFESQRFVNFFISHMK